MTSTRIRNFRFYPVISCSNVSICRSSPVTVNEFVIYFYASIFFSNSNFLRKTRFDIFNFLLFSPRLSLFRQTLFLAPFEKFERRKTTTTTLFFGQNDVAAIFFKSSDAFRDSAKTVFFRVFRTDGAGEGERERCGELVREEEGLT